MPLRLEHEYWVTCGDCDFVEIEISPGGAEEAAKAHLLNATDHMLHITAKLAIFNGCDECGSPVRFCPDDEPDSLPSLRPEQIN